MALAQFGHFAVTAAHRWLKTRHPERKARYEAWFREGWDTPFSRPEIARVLDAVR